MDKIVPPPDGPSTARVLEVGSRTYELRWVCCRKTNCKKCYTPNGWVPSHGPYWYLCYSTARKTHRLYIGKNLNTQKYIGADGRINFGAVNAVRKRTMDPITINEHQMPGQLDAIREAPPQPKEDLL